LFFSFVKILGSKPQDFFIMAMWIMISNFTIRIYNNFNYPNSYKKELTADSKQSVRLLPKPPLKENPLKENYYCHLYTARRGQRSRSTPQRPQRPPRARVSPFSWGAQKEPIKPIRSKLPRQTGEKLASFLPYPSFQKRLT